VTVAAESVTYAASNVDDDRTTYHGPANDEIGDEKTAENGSSAARTSHDGADTGNSKTEATKPGSTNENRSRFVREIVQEGVLLHLRPWRKN